MLCGTEISKQPATLKQKKMDFALTTQWKLIYHSSERRGTWLGVKLVEMMMEARARAATTSGGDEIFKHFFPFVYAWKINL